VVQDSVILPSVHIGQNCEVRRCVIDKGCQIPDGMKIGVDEKEDARHFFISPKGVRVITPEMLGQLSRYVR
jgi:glucose-1-phosphate adenylyltransferase